MNDGSNTRHTGKRGTKRPDVADARHAETPPVEEVSDVEYWNAQYREAQRAERRARTLQHATAVVGIAFTAASIGLFVSPGLGIRAALFGGFIYAAYLVINGLVNQWSRTP